MEMQAEFGDRLSDQSGRRCLPTREEIKSALCFVWLGFSLFTLLRSTQSAVIRRDYMFLWWACFCLGTHVVHRVHHFITCNNSYDVHAIAFENAPPRVLLRSRFCSHLDRTILCLRIRRFVPCTRIICKDIWMTEKVKTQHGIEAVSLGEPICFAWGLGMSEAEELAINLNERLASHEREEDLPDLFCTYQHYRVRLTSQAALPSNFPNDSVLQVTTQHAFEVLQVSKQSQYPFSKFRVFYQDILWTSYVVFVTFLAVLLAPDQGMALKELHDSYSFPVFLGLMLMMTGAKEIYLVDANKQHGAKSWTFSAAKMHEHDVESGKERSWAIRNAKCIYLYRADWPSVAERGRRATGRSWVPGVVPNTISGRRFAISVTKADGSQLCRLPASNDLTEGEATHLAFLMRERYPWLYMNDVAE